MSSAPDDLTLLLIGSLVAATLVALVLRGGLREQGPYALLLVADLVGIGFARSLASGALAFVAEGAGVVLSVAPALVDRLEGALYRRDRLRGALWLAKVREMLAPGVSSSRRRRELEQRVSAQSGDAGRAIEALKAELASTRDADDALRLRVDLVLLQLAAGEVDAALELAQRHFGPDLYQRSPELTCAVGSALSARGELPSSVQLLVLLEAQTAAAPGHRGIQTMLVRARLSFVAGAGLVELVDKLLAQPATRDEVSAHEAEALRESARRAIQPTPEARAVATQVAQRMLEVGERVSAPVRRRAPVTLAIIAANVVVMGAVTALGLGSDELGLARVGALYGPAVAAGEPWRLVSVAWLHANAEHIVANMYGLYILGRAIEELLGWRRLVVIYAVSAFGGALASLWADRGLSVGASGAIMGLLASLIVVIFARRRNFHPAARRMLLGNLLFLGLLQAFLGWQLPLIDSAAHGGGFLAGLVATIGLSPKGELSLLARRIATGAATLYALVCLATVPLVVRRSLEQTLLRLPTHIVELDGVTLEVPRAWHREDKELVDPYLAIEVGLEHAGDKVRLLSPQANDPRVRPLLERITSKAHVAKQ